MNISKNKRRKLEKILYNLKYHPTYITVEASTDQVIEVFYEIAQQNEGQFRASQKEQ